MLKKLLILCVLLLGSSYALTPPIDTFPITPPKLTCDSGTIALQELHIDVEVVGPLAQTTYTMLFYNNMDRVLEAKLEFPLPQGATVSRFAMDLNGKLREAVSVPKEKGRQVFEEIVRKNIDPALLEKTKGNNYKARVYPVPAKGYKKIVLRYESELRDLDESFLYTLPLTFTTKLDSFSVDMRVLTGEVKPTFKSVPDKAITFGNWEKSWNASFKKADYRADNSISFLVPKVGKQPLTTMDTEGLFYTLVEPTLGKRPKKAPKDITILWDVSTSAGSVEKDSLFTLLKSYLKWVGKAEITLTPFRNRLLDSHKITLKNGDSKDLLGAIQALDYDGATQLGVLDLNAINSDEIILVTDGLSNFGESSITLGKTPVYTFNAATVANHAYLSYVSSATGGVYFNLQNHSQKEILTSLQNQPLLFLGAQSSKEISDLYPATKQQVTGSFSLSGCSGSEKSTLTLLFGYGKEVTQKIEVPLSKNKQTSSSLVSLTWAQKKLQHLSLQPIENREAIESHAKAYNLVTEDRSLIVLDRLEDYVQYDITPPSELLEEFNKLKDAQLKTQKEKEQASIDKIVNKMRERQSWWEQDFDYKGCSRSKEEKKKMSGGRPRELMAESMSAPSDEMVYYEEASLSHMDGAVYADRSEQKPKPQAKSATGSITLKKWSPDTPYLKKLQAASNKEQYVIYLTEKKEYANSSAFFLDVADFFLEQDQKELALQILSNIAEMELENPQLLRILAHRLRQLGEFPLALSVFKEVVLMRAEEPQSYRDLGLTYADNGDFAKSVEMLYKVAIGTWDGRFSDIDIIGLNEMNGVIARGMHKATPMLPYGTYEASNVNQWLKMNQSELILDERLVKNMPCDVRVVLNWDADNCDMDLWVTDPIGEKCFYSHKQTCIGGHMSADFTQGYGPEEFLLKKAMPGEYKIEVNYYGNRQQTIAGATTVQVELITNFGRKDEKHKAITLRLKDAKEVVEIGTFNFE